MFPLTDTSNSTTNALKYEAHKRQHNFENKKFLTKVFTEDRRDKILEDVFMRSTQENPYTRHVNNSIELCKELKEESRQEFIEEKRRQQLRQNSTELRDLEIELRAAYIKKSISAQIYEQKRLAEEHRLEEKEINNKLEQARLRNAEAVRKLDEQKLAKRMALKKDLQEQIAFSNAQRQIQHAELMKEKEQLEEFIRKYKEDLQKEKQEEFEKKIRLKNDMEEWEKKQVAFRAAANKDSSGVRSRVDEVLEERHRQQKRLKEEKVKERLRKQQISKEIGQKIHAKQMKESQNLDNLIELLVDERKAKEELEDRQKLKQELQKRFINYEMLKRDVEERERRKLEKQKLEDEYFQAQKLVLAEKDKLQQLASEKRRREQLNHRNALNAALDEKKRLKGVQTKVFLSAHQKELRDEEKKQQLVEEERARMIKQHLPELHGFLPPSVLRDSDFKYAA